ncbi:MAG: glutathione S-transferase N-terminal domain-containing protein [Proteobacteria bacterium]|nr:glutathione S-transferase N-terminal domain-containing protein [Pseudomonadota bacterium]MBI3500054.1 glutathione S-transferase N-terminal domain-containing protein [Pseudomonadota bacterium]
MLRLYYSPGACSMASHIALEESGAEYEATPVLLAKGEQLTAAYRRINPRGKVPALAVDGEVLTENLAIMTYLALRFPDAGLLPNDDLSRARCLALMAWLSNTVHPSFTHIRRPERFAADAAAHATIQETGRKSFWANCEEIDGLIAHKQWMMGAQYSAADAYALVFYAWGGFAHLPMGELPHYTAFKDRMLQRMAVRRVLKRENNPLVAA